MPAESDSRPRGPGDAAPGSWTEGRTEFCRDVPWLLRVPEGGDGRFPLVVALHGMGMSARSFSRRLAPLLRHPLAIFVPQGPYPFEIREGGKMRIGHAWYQYRGDEEAWLEWMRATERHLLASIDRIAASPLIDPDRVVLLGYSQGCYLGYFVALRGARRFRGYVAIGGRLKRRFLERELASRSDLPVLVVHGRQDPSVPIAMADGSAETLREHGFAVDRVTTDSGHPVVPEQIEAAGRWIAERFV